MYRKLLSALITAFVLFVLPIGSALAAPGDEPANATQAQQAVEPAKKMVDLTDPDQVLNPDTYVKLLDAAKEWLITHGPSIVVALIILIVGRWLAMWFSGMSERAMGKSRIDVTLARFLSKLLYYALMAAVVIAAAGQMGIETTSFVAIFGAAGLAVGLALKDSLANFASGVMLILFRPFKVGDVVTAGGVTGRIQQIDIFSTLIYTPDNQKIIVPNSKITSDVITNINAEPTRRIDLVIGIGYEDDIRKAKSVLEGLVSADARILPDPAPMIAVGELADSSVNLVVRPWVKTGDYWDVRLDLLEKIKLAFDDEGISIPYPQQDVHMHQVAATA
ncbi:MAG: mechanosensitive ion channel family protein [Desulfopila sp.]